MTAALGASAVVLFDGDCSLCEGSVRFVVRRDPAVRFRFQSLQHPGVRAWLAGQGLSEPPDSLILVDDAGVHVRSEGALRIGSRLKGPWGWLSRLGLCFPRGLRDAVYDAVARRRRRWFPRRATDCPLTASLPAERLWVPPG